MGRLALALIGAFTAGLASLQAPDTTVRVTLQQQFGRAAFRECRLDLNTTSGSGTASVRCVRNTAPATEITATRSLTAQEVTRLAGLIRDSKLFRGDQIGTDTTASDGVFETLRVSVGAETVVLVTSGNPSFTRVPRRDLFDWLHALLQELRNAAR